MNWAPLRIPAMAQQQQIQQRQDQDGLHSGGVVQAWLSEGSLSSIESLSEATAAGEAAAAAGGSSVFQKLVSLSDDEADGSPHIGDPNSADEGSLVQPSGTRVKLMCSFGGRILPRPSDGKLRYVGGETRIISVSRNISYKELMLKMKEHFGEDFYLKYQLPNEDLDALISVTTDEDLQNMMEEYDRLEAGEGLQRLRVFLSSQDADVGVDVLSMSNDSKRSEQWYVEAVNGISETSSSFKRSEDESSGRLTAGPSSENLIVLNALEPTEDRLLVKNLHGKRGLIGSGSPSLRPLLRPHSHAMQLNVDQFSLLNPDLELSHVDALSPHPVEYTGSPRGKLFRPQHGHEEAEFEHIMRAGTGGHNGEPILPRVPSHGRLQDQPVLPQVSSHGRLPEQPALPRVPSHGRLQEQPAISRVPSHGRLQDQTVLPRVPSHGLLHDQQEELPDHHFARGGYHVVESGMPRVPSHGKLSRLQQEVQEDIQPDCFSQELLQQRQRYLAQQAQAQMLHGRPDFPMRHHQLQQPREEYFMHFDDYNLRQPFIDEYVLQHQGLYRHEYVDDFRHQYHPAAALPHYGRPFGYQRAYGAGNSPIVHGQDPHVGRRPLYREEHPRVHQHSLSPPRVYEGYHHSQPRMDRRQHYPTPPLNTRDQLLHVENLSFQGQEPSGLNQHADEVASMLHTELVNNHETQQHNQVISAKDGDKAVLDEALPVQKTPDEDFPAAKSEVIDAVPATSTKVDPGSCHQMSEAGHLAEDMASSVLKSVAPEAKLQYDLQHFDQIEMPSKNIATEAEKEAVDRGLQIIRNADLEEIKELGSGTYGTVYHGKWRGTDVAIKRIKASCFAGKESERERLLADFWREACTLSQLHHPNVVAFYGVVPDGPDGTLATVTEYMVNGSLKQVLHRKDRTIDRKKRVLIAMDAAFGMEYLHEKNIVHFDLKSENLLVNMRDPHRPVCKVGDLGLSKVKRQTMVSGGVRGTLPWMAPELLSISKGVTEKVDVYSFGVVMWEILTGEEPYANMHSGQIINGILNGTLRPEIPSWCEPSWRSLMERCWASDPTTRPTFSQIANELRAMHSSTKVDK